MKELEDTKCEVRRSIDLQLSIWDRLNSSVEDDGIPPVGSLGYNGSSAPLGNFFEDATYAWLSYGPRFVVLNVKTGTSISSWTFRERVTCVSPFPAQQGQVPLLLVGLDNGANKIRDSSGMVCVFDCTTSQVLRAVRTPAGVEQLCIVMGGAEWEDSGDKRVDNFFRENSGVACVALRNLDHLIVDLRRSSWEDPEATTLADESNPAELEFPERSETSSARHRSNREKHVAYNLMNSRLEQYIGFNREEFESTLFQEALTTSMICSRKIGCLVSGCLGRVIIWQMDGAVRWVSSPLEENMPVSHMALLEPTDDPRPFCYLWVAYQEETSRLPPVLRMYAMLFERKYSDKGMNAYFNLEGEPSLKFELELDEGNSVISLSPVVRESSPEQTESGNKRGEDSLLLISLDSRKILFDLNQWYKEQMPHTLGDCQNPNAFLASYRTRRSGPHSSEDILISSSYAPSSLKEFPSNGPSPPEELFFPNSLALEWIDVTTGRLSFCITRGLQADLLREMASAGPVILLDPSETYHRCVSCGLIANSTETSFNSDKDSQRETLLSLCLEQRWSQFLLKCAKDWSDGSASYLFHSFIRWGMQRASSIKLTAHRLCIPLYDQSGSSIGEAEVKTLRFFAQQLECIANVVSNLQIDSVDLTKQRRALRRVSAYLQVVLWFYDVGLLPETQEFDEEAALPIGFSLKIPYPFDRLAAIYREKREQFLTAKSSPKKLAENEENLFIDELLTRECSPLKAQWEREAGDASTGGNYPPSSLQSLLRSFLTDCYKPDSNEMENKHQITIYLLMDLAMLLQGSCLGVDQLIKYPSAFKLSPSLIKLTQALWLLDHEDYQGFLDMMTGQLVSDSDVKDWHHKLVLRTLIRNNQNKLALIYLRVRKPPLSSLEDQGTVISLSVEHGLLQSAFHRRPPSHYSQLLTRFFQACKTYGKLNDILHLALDSEEEEAFVKFLESEKSEDTRLLYYLQRCRYAEAGTVYPPGISSRRGAFQDSKQPASLTIFTAYNATLPEITRKFSGNTSRRVVEVDPESRYPRPMSHFKSRAKTREIHETVIRKAKETFLRGERSQIPFISAPCSSLRPGGPKVDTNCVLFLERTKNANGKRTCDDIHEEEDRNIGYNNGEERKRRKTSSLNDTPDENESKEVGMSMVFDTPLVKRKNQMINARNTPIETPHSILKIRQMIRDSTSPGVARPPSAEIPEEKERKPRQIRFSIGHQRQDNSIEASDNKEEEVEDRLAQGDVAEESDETEKSVNKASSEEEEQEGVEEEEESESFFSPNVSSSKSLSETTFLSDSSFSSRRSGPASSGPRPRPSLRRSNPALTNEPPSDLLRRSLMRASNASTKRSWTPTSSDSARISGDVSLSPYEEKSILTSTVPQSPKPRASLLSTSVYSSSILSSDTSFEATPLGSVGKTEKRRESSNTTLMENSIEKFRDYSVSHETFERSENLSRFGREVRVEATRKSYAIREEYRDEDDKNSEVLMEVDGFGLDREEDSRSRTTDLESNWGGSGDRRDSCTLPNIQSVTIPEVSQIEELEENQEDRQPEEEEEEQEEGVEEWKDKAEASRTSEKREGSLLEETATPKTSDDYEDELMALKYEEEDEEDNEETFQSLSNSLEPEHSLTEKSVTENKQTANNGSHEGPKEVEHNEEFNITDDESSRSVETSFTNESANVHNDLLEKTVSVDKIGVDIANITDDESNSTYDSSSMFSSKNRKSEKIQSEDKVNNEADSSVDSSIFSARILGKRTESSEKLEKTDSEEVNRSSSSLTETLSEETNPSPVKRGRQSSRLSKVASLTPSKTRSPRAKREVVESVELTPVRMTRSRRASSVALETPASPLTTESPSTLKTTAEKTGRLRRASSLAVEAFPSPDSNIKRTLSVGLESPGTGRRAGLRRSVSLAKELFASKALEEVAKEEELPVRRSSRKAASVQREIITESPRTPVKSKRASSKVSLVEEGVEEEQEEEITKKKTTRGRRAASVSKESEAVVVKRQTRGSSVVKDVAEEGESAVSEAEAPKRRTRASSVAKDVREEGEEVVEEAPAVTKRVTRKRGSSVPKEAEVGVKSTAARSRRGGSVSKDVIIEEGDEVVEETKGKTKSVSSKAGSPATSVRSRLSSISSIPEEEEGELFEGGSKGKKRATRDRRAASMEPPQKEVKRRTRGVKSAISEDAIEEEAQREDEEVVESQVKGGRKPTARRKRTTSGTSVKEEEEEVAVEKAPQRRTRKLSQRSNESTDSFRFSPPDQALDRPGDEQKDLGDVPAYVFSPPHTRSKHGTSIQPRREIKDFIPLTEKERKAATRASRPRVQPIAKAAKPRDLWSPDAVFVLPKRKNSTAN